MSVIIGVGDFGLGGILAEAEAAQAEAEAALASATALNAAE